MAGELFNPEPFEQIRGQIALPDLHPDLLEQCHRCNFRAYEHDPVDMRCPDDEDEAAINANESS